MYSTAIEPGGRSLESRQSHWMTRIGQVKTQLGWGEWDGLFCTTLLGELGGTALVLQWHFLLVCLVWLSPWLQMVSRTVFSLLGPWIYTKVKIKEEWGCISNIKRSIDQTDRWRGQGYLCGGEWERVSFKSANVCMSRFSILVHRLRLEREYSESNDCSGDVARVVILRLPRIQAFHG